MDKRNFRDVLSELAAAAGNNVEKGRSLERLVKAFLEQDRVQSARFSRAWLWTDWPDNGGRRDTGIDLVAEEREGGALVAIQCKFYDPSETVALSDISSFLQAYGTPAFASGIIVSTSERWSPNAEHALENRDKPVSRWGPRVFEESSVDWQDFDLDRPTELVFRETKTLRDYQVGAVQDVLRGFGEGDRGKLIMACGSGKTFTALRAAEQLVDAGGNVLFLTPSISLLSQSLIDWANDADVPLKTFGVCSDIRAGRRAADDEDISPYDLAERPSTDPDQLVSRFNQVDRVGRMTAIFSTYQSLDVVSRAQALGLPDFDLIICDEAHRTTGVSVGGADESNFVRVHDDGFIRGSKRLYMTATPRIYGDRARQTAANRGVALTSMDDESKYGPEFHRLGFGRAIELEILAPYKVIILNVDLEEVSFDLNDLISNSGNELNLDNAARMVGCWNALGKRGAVGVDFSEDPRPARRAVAFSNTIAQSKRFTEHFGPVIEQCIIAAGSGDGNHLRCEVHHVDGTQNALQRTEHLAWLRQEPPEGVCKILSNARCLTEGVDVPALDAILFLNPRDSEIDVVQAVGRVMRRSPGKSYGYIILPIAQAPGTSADQVLRDSDYRKVWQVINAIRAHDDRFEARINQLALLRVQSPGVYEQDRDITDRHDRVPREEEETQLPLLIAGSVELRDAILARIVDRYSDPRYWETWARNIREIAQRHEARIRALLRTPDAGVRPIFVEFLAGIRRNLNDGITEDDAIGMLSQHLITKPVFDALFQDYAFGENNPVSLSMQATIEALQDRGLEKETEGLDNFYRDVRIRAQGVNTAEGKQQVIAELYERFLKLALPDTAANLGIVYTPTDVVDYIVRSVEDVLQAEFGVSVSDEGVHLLDPFTGTGTFITRLLQSGLIRPEDLERKYREELHANEIMLLAYYIAAINIESAYHDLAQPDEYQPFEGIVLTDTFEMADEPPMLDLGIFPRNNERMERQRKLDIRVVLGNPPWSATNNRQYPAIDARVRERYAGNSTTTHLSALYDPYVKAIRWASDRVLNGAEGGVVAFVTNGGFIDSNAFDGFRKSVGEEFHSIYCFDLRGDQRTSGDMSRREGGKIFGSGSRARVALLFLVKKPGDPSNVCVQYRDIGDYLRREDKLSKLADSRLSTTSWAAITPNEHGDWVRQRSASFQTLRQLAVGSDKVLLAPIFLRQSLGLQTGRDAWCYNFSADKLKSNIERSVDFYNTQQVALQEAIRGGSAASRMSSVKRLAEIDAGKIHWRDEVYRDLANGARYQVNEMDFVESTYRPYFKQRLYFSKQLNCRIREFESVYPRGVAENLGITIVSQGSNNPFHALATNVIPDSELTSHTVYFPRWWYSPALALNRAPDLNKPELERISNINPQAVAEFREHYGDDAINDDDLFHYTYGVLHSPEYRENFADDLSKSPARMPMAPDLNSFRAFVHAGEMLAELHVNYECVEPYPLDEILTADWTPGEGGVYRVEKMAYRGPARNPDKTAIVYNAGITLAGIPLEAHQYLLGTRSALDWLIDRYQVRTHKVSGIVNDPNDWGLEQGNPRYILDLVKRVTRVSLDTVDIVRGLPSLDL